MDYIQLVGVGAAVLTTIANIPQTYKIIKEKNTEGISPYTYTILLTGTALWMIYGILNDDWPIIVGNGITVTTCIMILALYFMSNKVIKKIHDTVLPDTIKKKVRNKKAK